MTTARPYSPPPDIDTGETMTPVKLYPVPPEDKRDANYQALREHYNAKTAEFRERHPVKKLHPPPQVAAMRAYTYTNLIEDEEMPVEVRYFAKSVYNAAMQRPKFGPIMAAELALQMVRFFVSSPNERADMVARGETLVAQEEWARLEKRK